ncbi:MAG TPA: UPF0149 family protein [Steroidobacteraceae bacterium]|nr:UPF0149 family protein [Steroidobacteraceae bacterium]
MKYDPNQSPDPEIWLEADESERLILIEHFHQRQGGAEAAAKMHSMVHLVVENQLALPNHRAVQAALERLQVQGLDRHEAIHAIGSVLAEHLFVALRGAPLEANPNAAYDAALDELSAAGWRAQAHDARARPEGHASADSAAAAPHPLALSEAELDQLADFLSGLKHPDAFDLEGLDGFFCALVVGPRTVVPSEYLPVILGGTVSEAPAFASPEQAQVILPLIFKHWNAIIAQLQDEGLYEPVIDEPDERGVSGRRWARGFMRGVALSGESGWAELFSSDEEGALLTIPIVAGEIDKDWPREPLTQEKGEENVIHMAAGLARSYRYFSERRRAAAAFAPESSTVRRASPKVGRNDPCPCGSGKKFKHCCASSNPGNMTH